MRSLFISIFLLTVRFTFCQSATDYYKKADSLSEKKEFQKSAEAYSTALRMDSNPATSNYWSTAGAWSLAGNPDSAFHYLQYLAESNKVNPINTHGLEEDEDFNPLKSDKRWQPIVKAILKKAIDNLTHYADDVRAGKRVNPAVDRYNIAASWAILKNVDSTLFYLNSIVNSNLNRFTNYQELSADKRFSFLKDDDRWNKILETVNKNSVAFVCEHTPRYERPPMTLTIDTKSNFIRSDGKGIYKNDEQKISSYFLTAYNFLTSGIQVLDQSANWTDTSTRYFVVNLNSPVKSSGAKKQGEIRDPFASFHSFYRIDTALKLDLIYNLNQMPVGATIESPRTDIHFHINRQLHMLHFGYWGLGDCGEPYARAARINGTGTTLIRITRHSETSYTIEAPAGSIGRLWDISNLTEPVDKGLFKSGFKLYIEKQEN
jgi:tetratricopeptide (TPR) repeat protein